MGINFKERPSGTSKREWAAIKLGGDKSDYNSDGSKKGSGSSSSSKSSSKTASDMIKEILGATPGQQKTLDEFEKTYSPEMMAQDYSDSEALYKPYFEQQIANELEDLNAWSEAENVSYERSLRRARASLATSGGAIGSERDKQEGEMAQDKEMATQNQLRATERNVGTEKLTAAGYQSTGQNQEGSIVAKMKESVQAGQLWYKNQRAQRYMGNSENYYKQPSAYALDGSKM